ncbi:uncharacterized protein LOC133446350 isoform X2 [Cololabis saira]|uniref:uncharacterized protein LOC133446350 isoform X2 n=1 Tax=Cololabis saira TaxID=129043 RepID=UPI002AD55A1D|nr:uncharacterized protein LOC133446350 isoform X2 [Cololabis saira]
MSKPRKTSAKRGEDTRYREGLGPPERARYKDKLNLLGGHDPYELEQTTWTTDDPTILPKIQYPDIVNYLIFSPSPYTAEDLKAYKGLEAYNQMVCGWVRELMYQQLHERCIVKAKVLHSQSIRETPLEPWVIAEKSGRILGAHCTCVAGLGEVCTHVAALLFLIEEIINLRDSKTVTQEKAYWMLPTALSKVEYKECENIDFTAAKTYKVK